MVVFDATTLTLLLNPDARPPLDPRTKAPVEFAAERIDAFVERLSRDKRRVIIPTPVLAEVLVQLEEAGVAYVQRLQKMAAFEIVDFDVLAAVELSQMMKTALRTGDKKLGEAETPWQRIKIDRQIIAIARVKGAKVIFTDDGPLGRFAQRMDMVVLRLHTLPMPISEDALSAPADIFSGVDPREADDGDVDVVQIEEIEPEPTQAEIEAIIGQQVATEQVAAQGESGRDASMEADAVELTADDKLKDVVEVQDNTKPTVALKSSLMSFAAD